MSDITTAGFDPNISRLKRRAKALKKAVESGDPDALSRIDAFGVDPGPPFPLRAAQYVMAREHGYAGWSELISDVGDRMVDERDIHRWFGVELNNKGWQVIDRAEDMSGWPKHRVEEVLYRAYASTYHWMQVGMPLNHGRGEYLISRTAVMIGRPDLATHHASRYLEIVEAHPDLAHDWDRALAHECQARAWACAGRVEDARVLKRRAEELCALVADDGDRAVVEAALAQEPWFGT